jgi:DNA repair exonuclease SbcCD ATPase subunit
MLLIEELKATIDRCNQSNEQLEQEYKSTDKYFGSLEFVSKLINEYELKVKDLEKTESKLTEINKIIYEDTQLKIRKEKEISEILAKINNIQITIEKMQDYHKEFNSRQKKNIENEDYNLNEAREKYNQTQKRLLELNELIKEQQTKNTNLEDGVNNNFYNIDVGNGNDQTGKCKLHRIRNGKFIKFDTRI